MPAAIVLLGLATLLAYANSFNAGFTLDNHIIVEQDPRLREFNGQNIQNIFTQSYWWPYEPSELYRPLATLSYNINYTWFGKADMSPAGLAASVRRLHWTNFLLHWIDAALVYLVVRRLTANLRYAFVAAGLFALHPIAAESVTNLVGRADELATLGVLSGYLCYLRATSVDGLYRVPWMLGLAVSALFAMLSKESGLMLVPLLPLHDFLFRWPKLTGTWRDRLVPSLKQWWKFFCDGYYVIIPALLIWVGMRVYLVLNSPLYAEFFVDNPIAHAPQPQAFLTAVKVLGRYVAMMVVPSSLSCDYSYNAVPLYGDDAPFWEDLQSWVALGVIALLLTLAWRRRRTQPLIALGVFYFFVALLPTSNLLIRIGSIMAERFLYSALLGFCLVAAPVLLAFGEDIAARLKAPPVWAPWAVFAVPAFALGLLGVRTFARNADWQNDYTLWRSAVHAQPESFKVHKGYAFELWRKQQDETGIDATIARAEIGVAVLDSHPLPPPRQDNTLFNDLGAYYIRKAEYLAARNELGEARRYYLKSVGIMQRSRNVDSFANESSRRARIRRNETITKIPNVIIGVSAVCALALLGFAWYRREELFAAAFGVTSAAGVATAGFLVVHFGAFTPVDVGDVGNFNVHCLLATAYTRLGQLPEAEQAAVYARHLAPAEAQTHELVGDVLLAEGKPDEAAISYISALICRNDYASSWTKLRTLYEANNIKPVPIINTPTGPQLDVSNAMVRTHVTKACVNVYQQLVSIKLTREAEAFRLRAINDYKCPPELFAKSAPEPAKPEQK